MSPPSPTRATVNTSYLTIGEGVDPGSTVRYPAAIRDLDQLDSIPEMGVTPAQEAEGLADVAALTSFFDAKAFPQGF